MGFTWMVEGQPSLRTKCFLCSNNNYNPFFLLCIYLQLKQMDQMLPDEMSTTFPDGSPTAPQVPWPRRVLHTGVYSGECEGAELSPCDRRAVHECLPVQREWQRKDYGPELIEGNSFKG